MPDEVLTLQELSDRVAIIGAGNTGAQLATIFSSFGSQVTLLDVAPRILMASDALIAEHVSRAFVEQG
ncbi:MAG TPA: FAD-dependent oxidoreductase, partial [Actinomycetota bacterium]|nr:FAD-dependent oxidoreductase [Actinomycetota bacterium]